MLYNLPTELEYRIYNYLILPLDICKIKCLSKYFNKIVNSIHFIKQSNIIKNKAYMCLEDKNCYNEEIGGLWEHYSKITWPFVDDKEKNYTLLWKIGQYVDVLDKIQVWGSAKIIDFELVTYINIIDKVQTDRRYRVQFLGWGREFNEWVTPDRITFFGTKTLNPNNKYKSLKGSHKRWVLFKKQHYWNMQILTIKSINKHDKKLQVVGFYSNNLDIITVTTENIENILRSVSNATVYFSFKSRRIFENRILLH